MKKALKNILRIVDNESINNKPIYGINTFFIFNKYLMVKGWVFNLNDKLTNVTLNVKGKEIGRAVCGLPSEDINLAGKNLRFKLETLIPENFDRHKISLNFFFQNGKSLSLSYKQIAAKIDEDRANSFNLQNFLDSMKETNCKSILEIGSRARSGITRKELFGNIKYVGIDVLQGENVDIVGDAHETSRLVNGQKFDAVVSIYTFEHILMPWKVVLEINKILNVGGIGFILTHQTIGMHDLPWDYWRFSDTAWHSLFNKYTGFEIINTSLSDPMYLVPFTDFGEKFVGFEKSAGFYTSIVMFRKIADTNLSWDVPANQIAIGAYPG